MIYSVFLMVDIIESSNMMTTIIWQQYNNILLHFTLLNNILKHLDNCLLLSLELLYIELPMFLTVIKF